MRSIPLQPDTIVHSGFIYTLCQEWCSTKDINKGPFYAREGVDESDWVFQPDPSFLWNESECRMPTNMHCLQQSANPKTPHPAVT